MSGRRQTGRLRAALLAAGLAASQAVVELSKITAGFDSLPTTFQLGSTVTATALVFVSAFAAATSAHGSFDILKNWNACPADWYGPTWQWMNLRLAD